MARTKVPGSMTRAMVMVHTGFRREFGLMPEIVRGVFAGNRERADIIADHVELIWTVLHHHHHAEDLIIWPRLLERCPQEILPLVHGMENHHERIAALGDQLTKQAGDWRTDASEEHRSTVLRTLDDLLPVLREHLGAEEQFVLPLIEKHITGAEWDNMVAETSAELPQDKRPLVLGMMMYEGARSTVKDTLDNLPTEVRSVISEAAPRLYTEYAELVYGTPTPPFGSTLTRA